MDKYYAGKTHENLEKYNWPPFRKDSTFCIHKLILVADLLYYIKLFDHKKNGTV